MSKKKSTEEFIADARKIHGDKYDYSEVSYQGSSEKVIIKCPKHGAFLKTPQKHLAGQGCRDCNGYVPLTQQSFIERALKVHIGRYDYSQVEIKGKNQKIKIVCSNHGVFHQLPLNHINGAGCPECAKIARSTSQKYSSIEFIESVQKIHGNKYDYSKVNYINSQSKVEIICALHGPFHMKANSHFNGQGCPKCGRESVKDKITLKFDELLKRAEKVHVNRYEYLESSYVNYTSKMKIHCSEHGFFNQTPHSHISMKSGCPKCGIIKGALSNQKGWETVYDMFLTVHGNRYQYDVNSYSDVSHKMNIHCEKHGWFKQKPYQHYGGSGCNLCEIDEVHEKQKIDFNQFVERSMEKHGTRYDYSEAVYIDIFTPIHIICSHHGSFIQIPRDHYRGSGCPKCIGSRGENTIRIILQELAVEFVEQKSFDDLIYKSKLKCDFFLPDLNTVIEYNGLQHYEPVSIFGGIEGLIETQNRDLLKYEYLDSRGIDLIIIRYDIEDIKEYLQERLIDYLKD